MPPDDATLVKRCREGDRAAFRVLVERYQRRAYSQAYGMLKNREDALDVSQEAFVKVFRYLDQFKGDSSFYTWLFRIVGNLCTDALRKRTSQGGEALELDEELLEDGRGSMSTLSGRLDADPQRNALRAELGEQLERALEQVPPKHREILLLREVEGMSYEDLARVLAIPKGTVMSRLYHARIKVQRALAEYLDAPAPAGQAGVP